MRREFGELAEAGRILKVPIALRRTAGTGGYC